MMFNKSFLLSLLSFATVSMVGNWSGAIAETLNAAPIFQGIKNQIPRNLGFRLPIYMPVISEEVQPIFSISDQNIATVTLEFTDSQCRSTPKGSRGYLVGCRALSISSGSINSDFWRQRTSKGETFSLSENISAKHFQGDGWGMISWAQNGRAFSVYGPDRLYLGDGCNAARGHFCDFRSGELVKVARSMANTPIAPSQNATQLQPSILAQNNNSSKIVEIGRLSSGERVLKVPKEYLSQNGFREALQRPLYTNPKLRYSSDGEPLLYGGGQPRIFLWDEKKLVFVGYGISSLADFKVGDKTYWVSLCDDDLVCSSLLVSDPNLVDSKGVKGFGQVFLVDMQKDSTQEGFFYVKTYTGNGPGASTVIYLVNLALTVADPSQSAIVCEVTRYKGIGIDGSTAPRRDNPSCQTGRQVASRYTTTPSVPPSSTPVKPTDTIAKYPTNDDFNAFEDKLQGNPESLVKLRGNQGEQRRKFQNDWKDRNPNAAKFLGAWYTGDRYFYVFPSTVKGGTCVVIQDANSKLDMKIGTVLNQELRYGGDKGFFWRDRENIVASRDSGSGSLYPIYATSGMPELSESMIGDMERQKCITTLPFEADVQYYKERGDKFAKLGKKDEAISNYRKALELLRKQNQFAQAKAIEAQIVKLGGSIK